MARKLIVGNWKMHLNPHQASLLVHRLGQKVAVGGDIEVVLCPPMLDIFPLSKETNKSKFKLGAQNIHEQDEGPITGEVSAAMLKGLVEYAIVGHSDRRKLFGETDKVIAAKVAAALRNDIAPIICVGDTLLDREHGASRTVVIDQVTATLAQVTAAELPDVTLVYEPVWAISTSPDAKPDTPDNVTKMVSAIRHTVEELYGEGSGGAVRVLYGGSVNPDNARAFLKVDGVDGALVGGASIHYEQFAAIVQVAQDLV